MDPNQQPNQPLPPELQPTTPVVPVQAAPEPQPQPLPQPEPVQFAPAPPTQYDATPQQTYDPNYLDSIAPAAPRQNFLSGSFGKIFVALIVVFVLIVSFIVAFSGKSKTADLQQVTVRVTNFALLTKSEQPYLKNAKLINTNTTFQIFLTNAQSDGENLLKAANVKKQQYSKTMVTSEKKLSDDLTAKFTDARLNVVLDTTYASSMAIETQKLLVLYNTMAKNSGAKAIRDYAKKTAANLTPIQKAFDGFTDTGN